MAVINFGPKNELSTICIVEYCDNDNESQSWLNDSFYWKFWTFFKNPIIIHGNSKILRLIV